MPAGSSPVSGTTFVAQWKVLAILRPAFNRDLRRFDSALRYQFRESGQKVSHLFREQGIKPVRFRPLPPLRSSPMRTVETRREQWRKWYHAHKADQNKKVYFNRSRRKARLLAWFAEFKAQCRCARCGFDHPAALDFHHRDPSSKGFPIAEAVRATQSIARLQAEIQKCDVLCANCHRIEHFDLRDVGKRSAA